MNGIQRTGGLLIAGRSDTSWKVAGTGDFNADGKVVVWLMNGTTLTCGVFTNADRITDPNWSIAGPR